MATRLSSSKEGLRKLEEQINCPICLEHFTNPKLLPCSHSFCLECLQRVLPVLVEGNHSIDCPTCRSPCPVPDKGLASLPPSFVINNLMEVYDLMKKVSDHQHVSCDNCDNTNADRYCKQCSKFLCSQCLHFHDNWRPNTGHQLLSLEEVVSTVYQLPHAKPDPTMSCTDHSKPLDIYCETCQQLICHHCTVKKHTRPEHDYDLVTDTYRQYKDTIVQSSLQPLGREHDRLEEAKRILIDKREAISQQAKGTKEEIHHTIAEIKNRLDETERKLMEDVDLVSTMKFHVLDYQLKETDLAIGQVTECNDYVEQCIKVGEIKNRLDETERKLMEDVDLVSTMKFHVLDYQLKETDLAIGQVTECNDYVEQCIKVGSPQQVLLAKPQMMSRTQSVITSVKGKTFKPLEQPDIQLVKSDTIHQIHNNIGKIKYTLNIPHSAKVSYDHIPLVKQQSTVTISLTASDGSLVPVPSSLIKWRLTPPDNTPPIQCSVKESSQSGQYDVVFTPLTRGLHQLHITVYDCTIPGTCSLVNVPVTVPVHMSGSLVKNITGLRKPSGVAVTDDGLVVVIEADGGCITILDNEAKKIRSFGSRGTNKGQLQYPQGVAVTSRGTILVADCSNHRIQEFTMEGDCISCVGTKGDGPPQFSSPRGIAINKTTGQVLIADANNNRIQVLHPDLTFSHMFGSKGSGHGQINKPHSVTIDSKGFVYVTDFNNHRIQKFTAKGQFVSSFGTNPGQLSRPSGITVDDNDLLYVNNGCNNYVTIYTTNGQHVHSIDNRHALCYCFSGIAITSVGLLVCCPNDGKIEVLQFSKD